jgi:hypothetical protein
MTTNEVMHVLAVEPDSYVTVAPDGAAALHRQHGSIPILHHLSSKVGADLKKRLAETKDGKWVPLSSRLGGSL